MNQNEQPTLQAVNNLAEELNITCTSSEYTFDLDATGETTLGGTYQALR